MRDLWTCPHYECQFTNRKLSHTCERYTMEEHHASVNPQIARLYSRFIELVNYCLKGSVQATKTSIDFKSSRLFAVVNFQKSALQVGFWLSRRVENPRIMRIYVNSPQEYAHHLNILSVDDQDEQRQKWLREAYAVGM